MENSIMIPLSSHQNKLCRETCRLSSSSYTSNLWPRWGFLSGTCPKVFRRVLATTVDCLYSASSPRPSVLHYVRVSGNNTLNMVCMWPETKLGIFHLQVPSSMAIIFSMPMHLLELYICGTIYSYLQRTYSCWMYGPSVLFSFTMLLIFVRVCREQFVCSQTTFTLKLD